MMIDDDTLKQLLRINDELFKLGKWLNEKRDMETSSRLIPLVDELTHILAEAGKNKLQMPKSVLIVDDNQHLRTIYSSILRASGYEIVEAEKGADAIEKAASAQPHVILLDLVLPHINGIDVARSMKRN